MEELFQQNLPDAATPLNSTGGVKNAAGDFDLVRKLERKKKSRKDLDQPKFTEDDAIKRYYGDFSLESKRHVWDLLDKHPLFSDGPKVRMNRVGNNTREVLPNDPTKLVENGGHIVYDQQPQASQEHYDDGKNH